VAIFTAVDADVLQVHRFDASVLIGETMKVLHDLVECGKVKYLGATAYGATSLCARGADEMD
jgi:aryl-alcohol dehydrogenase-like predicted oxidoreductase